MQELVPRDVAMANNMLRTLRPVDAGWAAELEKMVEGQRKAEIEAVYSVCGAGGFVDLLADCLTAGEAGRGELGSVACCKGLVAGRLVIHNRSTGELAAEIWMAGCLATLGTEGLLASICPACP